MAQLDNCPKCGRLFVKNQFRDICDVCYKEEEKLFEKVYNFLRKRENRTATLAQVVAATEVDEGLIIKWIKKGRIQLLQFPNLGYPCDKCGKLIREGRLCAECNQGLQQQLQKLEEERQRQIGNQRMTYYTKKDEN